MKYATVKILSILILFSASLSAQISSNPASMHGSYGKKDTATERDEDPPKPSHEQVTIIKKRKLTPAEAAAYTHKSTTDKSITDSVPRPDTTSVDVTRVSAPTIPDTTMSASTSTATDTTSSCSCINSRFIYDSLGLLALSLLLSIFLFIQLLRNQKRPPFISAMHCVLGAAGMTLLITYSIYQPFPLACLMILILAGVSSVGLMFYDVTGRTAPKGLAVLHGALTLIGVILLFLFALKHCSF